MISKIDKNQERKRRHLRVRNKVSGTAAAPRLCVYRSLNHIYAQIIDDTVGNTLVAASTLDKAIKADLAGKTKSEEAKLVGELLAKKALEKGIETVVFDRGGYLYTGRVASLADGAREGGLKF
ncbi:MAG: 50S ribosomal protein L18 [Firmicutes bacterium]|jgi:ribosomal protein L18|nr:50S ribosomal protein L18 [Bacillota bacterium]